MKKFTLKMLALATAAVSLSIGASAMFEKTTTYVPGTFTDIPNSAWYAKEVQSTYELGFMQGTSDTLFSPEDNVTLAQAITVASRVCAIYNNEEIPTPEEEGAWYQMYVDYAVSKGFFNVSEDESIDFNRPASRIEVAMLFSDALPEEYFTAKNDVDIIPDMLDGTAGYDKLLRLYRAGVVLGNDDIGSFYPKKISSGWKCPLLSTELLFPQTVLQEDLKPRHQTTMLTFWQPIPIITVTRIILRWYRQLLPAGVLTTEAAKEEPNILLDMKNFRM